MHISFVTTLANPTSVSLHEGLLCFVVAKKGSAVRVVKQFASDADIMAANFERHFRELREQIVELTALNIESVIARLANNTRQLRACIG